MWIGILGPLEVRTGDGAAVAVAGARLRALLIALALDPGRVVPTAGLVDAIWGEEPPAGAANALQALVSRLRRTVPAATLETHPAGYRLRVEPDAVDATRFAQLAAAGRSALAGDPAAAARTLREALGLWRGPALLDVADAVGADYFRPAATQLSELRLAATEDRVEAELRLGGTRELGPGSAAALIAELASLVAAQPLRERLVGALMRVLVAAGRPADALAEYARIRQALAEALGTDPSPELSALHTAILRGELGRGDGGQADGGPDDVGLGGRTASPGAAADGARTRTNLRAGLTSFVGRDDDVARVRKLVYAHRLTTLTGPGGSGKTRLAVETSRTLLEQAPHDGVWLVELAPVTDPAGVPQAVLAALGLRERALPGRGSAGEPIDQLVAALSTRSALLVLDNCEHLIDAAAELADRLLGECPQLRILATSREPLGLTGEAAWPVEPLTLPPEGVGLADAMAYSSVRLLDDRAGAAYPGFAITEDTLPAVVRTCRALDGMPLAIELAAARLRSMSPEQLADALDLRLIQSERTPTRDRSSAGPGRFRLLTGGSRTALPRHRTLRAVVDWSWELLSGPERTLLRRLAVFSGGATVEAAEQVCAGDDVPADQVLDLLTALTDKSLLVAGRDAEPRYRMLETIRAYCLEKLDEASERDRIRRTHAAYFTELVEAADPHLRRTEQLVWLRRLAADHDNITAALRGAIAAGEAQEAVRLAVASGWYWWLTGRKAEGVELTTAALAVPGPVDDEVRAAGYAWAAMFATAGVGDWRLAESWLDSAQAITGEGRSCRSPVLRLMAPMRDLLRGLREANSLSMDPLEPVLADEDPWVRAVARMSRADVWRSSGHRYAEAEVDVEAALAEFRTIGERWGISFALSSLADLVAQRGDLPAALDHCERAIAVASELGSDEDVIWMRLRQAQLRWLSGDPAGGAAAIAEAERDAARVTWPDAVAGLAYAKAELARSDGDQIVARAELVRAETVMRHVTLDPVFRAMLLNSHAYVDGLAGDPAAARAHRSEALALALESADVPMISQVLVGVADDALRQDQPVAAATLLAAGVALRGTPDRSNPDAIRVEAIVRAALGEPELAEATRAGQQLMMPEIRESAAAVLAPRG